MATAEVKAYRFWILDFGFWIDFACAPVAGFWIDFYGVQFQMVPKLCLGTHLPGKLCVPDTRKQSFLSKGATKQSLVTLSTWPGRQCHDLCLSAPEIEFGDHLKPDFETGLRNMTKTLSRVVLFIFIVVSSFGLLLYPTIAETNNSSSPVEETVSVSEVSPLISAQITFTPVVTIYLPIMFSSYSPNEEMEIDIELPGGLVYQVGDTVEVKVTVSSIRGVDNFTWGIFTSLHIHCARVSQKSPKESDLQKASIGYNSFKRPVGGKSSDGSVRWGSRPPHGQFQPGARFLSKYEATLMAEHWVTFLIYSNVTNM